MDDLVDVDEWRRWLTSRRGRDRWRAWAEPRPALRGWDISTLAEPRWSPLVDRLQRDLVALAQEGEGRAAITLLVQLRPGLYRLVRSRGRGPAEARSDACDEVRAVFYETVWRHRLDRRPERIAANLVLDTRQRLGRADRAGRPPEPTAVEWSVRMGGGGHPVASPRVVSGGANTVDPLEGAALRSVLVAAVDGLPGSAPSRRTTAEAAFRVWVLDQPQAVVARELGLTPATVATRLHRLRAAVRREWAAEPGAPGRAA
jgi:DNA-directed RNA polymerase specialized sigma24 family protein